MVLQTLDTGVATISTGMDENSIRILSSIATSQTPGMAKSAPTASDDTDAPNFQQLLATLMLASTLSSSSGGGGGAEASSPLGGDLFSPILFTLMEQLLGRQQGTEGSTLSIQPSPQGLPVEGRLTQNYHAGHNGLDFGVAVGTPIRATMNGEVVYAGWNDQGYGNLVIVENGAYRTYYAHLSSIPVTQGQSVQANNIIGLSGNTGNSTGPHLHYEIRQNGQAIDPTAVTLG